MAQEAGGECFAPKKELSWKSWKEMLGAVSTCCKATRYLDSCSMHPLKRNVGIETYPKIFSSGVLWYGPLPSRLEILEKFHYVSMFSAHHCTPFPVSNRGPACAVEDLCDQTLGSNLVMEGKSCICRVMGAEWTKMDQRQLRAWIRTLVDVFFACWKTGKTRKMI